MSIFKIRAAFETDLAAMTPALPAAWENGGYVPKAGVPYQAASVNPAAIINDENGLAYQQTGFFQVELRWPAGTGTKDIGDRAELIRDRFPKKRTLVADGQTVQVTGVPNILPGYPGEDGRYVVAVSIPFLANLQT